MYTLCTLFERIQVRVLLDRQLLIITVKVNIKCLIEQGDYMKQINFHNPKKINNNKRKLNINKNIYSAEFDHF